ncbi:hypothetical protein MVEN_02170600 [Mycena venus]|uniref:Secreted protein n=1 Tax=Mycena venus TaxID=2733690 RepID=A0A8H6X870_9AGAR|nr:hypothetical protein MVEN_02170600 [Mycena venus]
MFIGTIAVALVILCAYDDRRDADMGAVDHFSVRNIRCAARAVSDSGSSSVHRTRTNFTFPTPFPALAPALHILLADLRPSSPQRMSQRHKAKTEANSKQTSITAATMPHVSWWNAFTQALPVAVDIVYVVTG